MLWHVVVRNQNSHERPCAYGMISPAIYAITFSFHHTLRSNRLLFFLDFGFGGSGATKTSPAASALTLRPAITVS